MVHMNVETMRENLVTLDISTKIIDSIAWALATRPMGTPQKTVLAVLPCWLEKICAKE